MRWQISPRDHQSGARLALRLERAAAGMNPYLLCLVIGLVVLNVTFFVAAKVSPPRPINPDAAISMPITP